jgi:hypothetical protein
MTDHDRNMRTLVLCFVLAIMALIPLKFVELGNQISSISNSQVLGETVVNQDEVVLPNGNLDSQKAAVVPEVHESALITR